MKIRIVVLSLLTATILTGNCDTIQKISDQLLSLSAKQPEGKLQIAYEPVWMSHKFEGNIIRYGSLLTDEKSYTNAIQEDEEPYAKTIEEYSTNGYRSFNEGGILSNTKHVTSEAELRGKEEPLLGLPLFTSRFHQARLLLLLKAPTVEDVQFEGEATSAIKGQVVRLGTLSENVTLFYSKSDFLLVGQELSTSDNPFERHRFVAIRTTVAQSDWPYSSIIYEQWSRDSLVKREIVPVFARHIQGDSGIVRNGLRIPDKTLVTDERFGFPVIYRLGEDPRLTDEDIAKMATDPDYRTNSYYLKFNRIVSSKIAADTNVFKRSFVILTIGLTSLIPVFLILRQKRRGINSD